MSLPSLSIVIPLYNEAGRVDRLLEELSLYGPDEVTPAGMQLTEVVIAVDDGSTDTTVNLLRAADERVPHLRVIADGTPNVGKGAAVWRGRGGRRMGARHGRRPGHPAGSAPRPRRAGPRRRRRDHRLRDIEGAIVTGAPRHRFVLGRIFNKLVRENTGLDLRDTQCGFKLLRTAQRDGLRIAEAAVYYVHAEESKMNPLAAGPRMLFDVLRIAVTLKPWRRPR